jgi:ribonuclease BN (tRNA processing enzyme)
VIKPLKIFVLSIGIGFILPALAQDPANATPPASATRLITLGTAGGPQPRAHRSQSSDLLVVNGTPYVIDAGDNVTRRIVQAGFDFRTIKTIFITHEHSDHILGLAALLVSEWERQPKDPINIYGPPGTVMVTQGVMDFAQANADIRWSESRRIPMNTVFKAHDMQPGVVYQDKNIKVVAAENTHFHFEPGSPPYGKYKSYSYRFETPDKIIMITGDTGPSDAVTNLAKGADIMVSEVLSLNDTIGAFKKNGTWQAKSEAEKKGTIEHFEHEHLTPQAIGEMASKAGVKMVVLTHLPASDNPDDDFSRYGQEVKKYFKGDVRVAKDLMEF